MSETMTMLTRPVAHSERFRDGHRVQSSAELAELVKKSAARCHCSAHPVMLLLTSLPSVVAGLIHGLVFGRWVAMLIYAALGVASCFFHYWIDWALVPSPFWSRVDRGLAYMGIAYHLYLWSGHYESWWCGVAALICFSSLRFYFTAYEAFNQGNFARYVQQHSLWHATAALGTLMFSAVAN